MRQNPLPTPPEIAEDPELAVLAVLEFTLEATVRALVAAHPEICDDPATRPLTDPRASLADRLVSLACRLDGALTRYRGALGEARHQFPEETDPDF